ncbi:MAG: hypothetical protein ACXADY_24795 [Candidatus Hodarchaeales archaeon]|jgi:hypothetical protein
MVTIIQLAKFVLDLVALYGTLGLITWIGFLFLAIYLMKRKIPDINEDNYNLEPLQQLLKKELPENTPELKITSLKYPEIYRRTTGENITYFMSSAFFNPSFTEDDRRGFLAHSIVVWELDKTPPLNLQQKIVLIAIFVFVVLIGIFLSYIFSNLLWIGVPVYLLLVLIARAGRKKDILRSFVTIQKVPSYLETLKKSSKSQKQLLSLTWRLWYFISAMFRLRSTVPISKRIIQLKELTEKSEEDQKRFLQKQNYNTLLIPQEKPRRVKCSLCGEPLVIPKIQNKPIYCSFWCRIRGQSTKMIIIGAVFFILGVITQNMDVSEIFKILGIIYVLLSLFVLIPGLIGLILNIVSPKTYWKTLREKKGKHMWED